MLCKNCGKINEEGKFCESCGTELTNDAVEEVASASEADVNMQTEPIQSSSLDNVSDGSHDTHGSNVSISPSSTSSASNTSNVSEYVDIAKDVSKTYFSYFMKILKNPLSEAREMRKEEFTNGIITIVLYAILIPLMVYLSLGSAARGWMTSPFLNIFLKPAIGYAVFIFLVAGFTFLSIQLGRGKADIKDVISRFGALLVPFVALFIIGFVLAILQTGLFAVALSLGFIGSTMAVPPLVIQSFKKNVDGGLDTMYGVVLTYVLTGVTLAVMSAVLLESIYQGFGEFINIF